MFNGLVIAGILLITTLKDVIVWMKSKLSSNVKVSIDPNSQEVKNIEPSLNEEEKAENIEPEKFDTHIELFNTERTRNEAYSKYNNLEETKEIETGRNFIPESSKSVIFENNNE